MIGLVFYLFFLVVLLNVNYVDGIDVSWIWDGNFENFVDMDILVVIFGGDCYIDMILCLKVVGILENKLIEIKELLEVIEKIKELLIEYVYILVIYIVVL